MVRILGLQAGELDLVAGVADGVDEFHGGAGGDTLVERRLAEHGTQVVDGGGQTNDELSASRSWR